ncbi:LysM peptidoglycan-binding domain-containing protein (plasmid) [Streptomyces cellulosae]|uniref:LysM peptidoglycan-binding domain-containing protein n=1 Tax=Streptomyces cellulosae TaxID=1968 RepID=UPI002F908731|nr:LysM peptidoglycan-binding domain-containing protein [Streptomyces cellulosae]
MTPSRSRTTQKIRAVDVVRGLASLVALVALLAGLPVLLWFLTGVLLPDGVSVDEVTGLLTTRNLGAPFFAVVLAGGWMGWIVFAVCTLLEIPAQLRGRRPDVHVPAFGVQRLAALLVGGVLILLPTGTAIASPASAATNATPVAPTSVSAPATAGTETPATTPASAAASASETVREQFYTVEPRDSLSKIAMQELGDATRWREIAQLNNGKTMVDGTRFSTRGVLQPGWKLAMPDDWHTQRQALAPQTGTDTHTVRPGETLSGIAEKELGDADAYPEIAELNEGHRQPDGRTFTDPDRIYPGWKLALPNPQADDGESAPPKTPSTPEQDDRDTPDTPRTDPPATPDDSQQGGTGHAEERQDAPEAEASTPAPHTPAPEASPTPHTPATATPHQPAPEATAADEPTDDQAEDSSVLTTAVAVTSLFAATVLAVLGARRAQQQRRRRHKRRIPMPDPNTPAADVEHELRAASDASGLDLVGLALRTLAANCAQAARPLPEVDAVRITSKGIALHLAAPTPPVAPFALLDGQPDVWWCPARGAHLLTPDEARDVTAPYPALVSLGKTEDNDPVLVNLESVGLLRLGGTAADVRAVLLGLAFELANSQLSDDATVVLSGIGEELASVFPARVQHHAQLADAVSELVAHDAFQRGALDAADLDHLQAARLADDGGDTWVPKILLCPGMPSQADADVLADLLASRPRTAIAVITAADAAPLMPSSWTLPATPGGVVELPGHELAVHLQRVDDETYQPLLELLSTANRTDDVPAPAWTHAPDGTPMPNGPVPVPAPADSALSPETGAVRSPTSAAAAEPVPGIVSVTMPHTGEDLATALPSMSALAPAVTGLPPAAGDVPDHTEPDPYEAADPYAEPYGEAPETNEPEEPAADADFGQVLTEVLQEQHAGPAAAEAGAPDPQDEDASALAPATQTGGQETEEPSRPAPRVTAVTSSVLAALTTPPDPPAAPQIRVLGPVDVVGTLGKVESYRVNALTEIAAWMVLHPGGTRHELDEAIWPGQRILANARNSMISKLRTWLGRDPRLPADDPQGAYLPPIAGGVYAFNDQVTSDWAQFQELYLHGMHHTGSDADIALAQALALVRGRPFSNIDQSKYVWAEQDIQEMISAVVDVAHELTVRRMAAGDYRAAATAAGKGLTCDVQSELLYRDLFTIYSETGDRAGLERTAQQLNRIALESGCDAAPETVSLINALMDANRIASA